MTAPPALTRVPRMFLSAEWRWPVMLNFEFDPKLLEPLVPADTELDDWNGVTYASVVGFMFLRTRAGAGLPRLRGAQPALLRAAARRRGGGEYVRQRDSGSVEYAVEHPRWPAWRPRAATLDADLAALYGPALSKPLAERPRSQLVAEGSPVVVRHGVRID